MSRPCTVRLDFLTRRCGVMPWMSTPSRFTGSSSTPGFTSPSSGSSTPVQPRSLVLPCRGVWIYPHPASAVASIPSPRWRQVSLPPITRRSTGSRPRWPLSSTMSKNVVPAPFSFRRSARRYLLLWPIISTVCRSTRSLSTATGAPPGTSCEWPFVPWRLVVVAK